ncbi:MAG TPA: outer membrane lipoprotein carrier protein LolA [Terriglobales bacterium]|nr:outer membrane lipoprotein carrier protein LolA [Terriglobales bacterium]
MKKASIAIACVLALALSMSAQSPAGGGASLQDALKSMDRAAAGFKTAQADTEADQYSKIVNETDVQKGTIYFRRSGKDIEIALDITQPDQKYVVVSGGKVDMYQPKIDQVTEYNAGKNKSDVESFMVLGFGGSGQELQKSFEVKFAGNENVGGVNTAKLELTPKAVKVRNMFNLITLWIDPARGVSVQQRFDEPSGDYRLTKYSNIKINENLNSSVFKLKTTGKTKWVRPQ